MTARRAPTSARHCVEARPASTAQRFWPSARARQPQWLQPQSSVPDRQSAVHMVPGFITPALAAATQASAWQTASGAQSASTAHPSSEKRGARTEQLSPSSSGPGADCAAEGVLDAPANGGCVVEGPFTITTLGAIAG